MELLCRSKPSLLSSADQRSIAAGPVAHQEVSAMSPKTQHTCTGMLLIVAAFVRSSAAHYVAFLPLPHLLLLGLYKVSSENKYSGGSVNSCNFDGSSSTFTLTKIDSQRDLVNWTLVEDREVQSGCGEPVKRFNRVETIIYRVGAHPLLGLPSVLPSS
jgi:hypothetical protein